MAGLNGVEPRREAPDVGVRRLSHCGGASRPGLVHPKRGYLGTMRDLGDGVGDRLRAISAVTDASIGHLDVDDLLVELLGRNKE